MAAHHAAHRMAFGRTLAGQPLMAAVLADLAIESEATTLAAFRLAGATDRAVRGDAQEAAFRRLALAATKYWVCKRAPAHAAEALECLGGNGYVEESGMPRLYREAPLASIWEGSGNVAALDALRALTRQPESAEAFFGDVVDGDFFALAALLVISERFAAEIERAPGVAVVRAVEQTAVAGEGVALDVPVVEEEFIPPELLTAERRGDEVG